MRQTCSFIIVILFFSVLGCIEYNGKENPISQQKKSTSITTQTTIREPTTISIDTTTTTRSEIDTTTTISTSTTTIPRTLEISEDLQNNCIGFSAGMPEEIDAIPQVGGGWVRPHPGPFAWGYIEEKKGEFNFNVIDEYVKKAQENKVGILATIWPFADWDQESCHDYSCQVSERDIFYPRTGKPGKEMMKDNNKDFKKEPGIDYTKGKEDVGMADGIPKMRCIPCDMEDYKEFLTRLVERYDGDGFEDMNGLMIPMWYYEILNEPSMQGGNLCFFKGKPAEYLEILKASHEAIKKACPRCKIVQGGASGNHDEPTRYWDEVFKLGGGKYIDIANIHFINYGDVSTLNVRDVKKIMSKHGVDKPIWVTEAEFQRMDDIDTSVTGAFNAGAERIFFPGFGVGHGPLEKAEQYKPLYQAQRAKCN